MVITPRPPLPQVPLRPDSTHGMHPPCNICKCMYKSGTHSQCQFIANLLDVGAAQSFFSVSIQDEYDPARPNDYEEVRRTRERQRLEAEREAERQEELRAQKAAQEVGACKFLVLPCSKIHTSRVSQGTTDSTGQWKARMLNMHNIKRQE